MSHPDLSYDRLAEALQELATDMAEVKANLKILVGNGQPGLIQEMREKLSTLDKWRWILVGAVALVLLTGGVDPIHAVIALLH